MPLPVNPLALDPLSPIGIAEVHPTTDPLALDPLSPLPSRAPATDAETQFEDWLRQPAKA